MRINIVTVAALLMSVSGIASANFSVKPSGSPTFFERDTKEIQVVSAPEIDPASAVTAVTLLLGGLTVMRGRITKK